MPQPKGDFDPEILGKALQERSERGQQFIDKPLAMQARLFATVAEEVIKRFADDGRDAIIEAVQRFGEERGRRIAERAISEGRKPTFAEFLVFSDLDTSQLQMVPSFDEDALRLEISYCPFAEACRQWGLEDYGKHFCENVDSSIMRGYNPESYETVCERNLTGGSETCTLIYRKITR